MSGREAFYARRSCRSLPCLRLTLALLVAGVLLSALAGCGGSGSSPASTVGPTSPPSTVPPVGGDESADAAVVRSKGYDVTGPVVRTSDGSGHTLFAFHGTCHGSADGYCQTMLFFLDTRYLGTDTPNASTAITAYRAEGVGSIAVTYPTYKSSDPLCCPSGAPFTLVFHWNGSRLVAGKRISQL